MLTSPKRNLQGAAKVYPEISQQTLVILKLNLTDIFSQFVSDKVNAKVIREKRMRWLGHVTRMDQIRIPKQALHWEVAGFRRRPGRRRMNWRDVVKKDLQRMRLTWEEVEASA